MIVSVPLETGVRGAVPSSKLLEFLGKSTDEELGIESDGKELLLSGKRVKVGIPISDLDSASWREHDWPEKGWEKVPDGFLESVRIVSESAGDNLSQPIFTMVHVTQQYVEASDNYLFSRVTLPTALSGDGFLLPAARVRFLESLEPAEYAVSPSWVYFRSAEGGHIAFRTFDGKYIDPDRIFPEGEEIAFPSGIGDALDRSAVFVDPVAGRSYCKIKIEKNKAEIEARGVEGWIREKVRTRYEGKALSLLVRPRPFREALQLTNRAIVGDSSLMLKGDRVMYIVWLPADE